MYTDSRFANWMIDSTDFTSTTRTTRAAPVAPVTPVTPAVDSEPDLCPEVESGEAGRSDRSDQPDSTALADVQVNVWVSINSPLDLLFDEARRLRIPYSALVRSILHKYLDDQYVDAAIASEMLRCADPVCRI